MPDTRFPSPKEVELTHTNADKDGTPTSLHHTLGNTANQASPGDHSHDGGTSKELDGYSLSTHDHSGLYLPNNVPWIAFPFSGGWTDYATGFNVCQYRLVGDEVQWRGLMKHPTITTTGTFATMPVGYRPPSTVQSVGIASGPALADLRITNAGTCTVSYQSGGNGGSVSLWVVRYSIL